MEFSHLLKYWEDEKQAPRYFNDATDSWRTTKEQFLEFCAKCAEIHEFGERAVIYIEDVGHAQIHFSVLRGARVTDLIPDFIKLRDETLKRYKMIFGWVCSKNVGLKRILRACEFEHNGMRMFHHQSHGRVMEWHCFAKKR